MPMCLDVLAAWSGLFCLLSNCSFPDFSWLSVLSKWIYFPGPSYSLSAQPPPPGDARRQPSESCWHCCPRWMHHMRMSPQDPNCVGQVSWGSGTSLCHDPQLRVLMAHIPCGSWQHACHAGCDPTGGFPTSGARPLHSTSTSEVRNYTPHLLCGSFHTVACCRANDAFRLQAEPSQKKWLCPVVIPQPFCIRSGSMIEIRSMAFIFPVFTRLEMSQVLDICSVAL